MTLNPYREYRTADEALIGLADLIINTGDAVPSRAGDTLERTFMRFTVTDPLHRELTVPGRKASIAAQIAETMWVLSGRNDVEWLSHYLPRAAEFSDDGKVWRAGYGPRLRNWDPVALGYGGTDQMAEVINKLQVDPNTRQAVLSIWDPSADWVETKDVPCNNWLHFLHRDGRLHLHVAIRSNDLWWGWSGINQFEWSTLLEIVAGYAGMEVGSIHYAVSSLHLYDRHWKTAERLPKPREDGWLRHMVVAATPRFWNGAKQMPSPGLVVPDWDELCRKWFDIEEIIRERPGALTGELIADFPEPMLRSWLLVLHWWWTGDEKLLDEPGIGGTRLRAAALAGVQPKREILTPDDEDWPGPKSSPEPSAFMRSVIELHNSKHAAYGDSWKRRGEKLGIMANIARKVDRLGGGETSDETQLDTAIDLLVYLAKYCTWLDDTANSHTPDDANSEMVEIERQSDKTVVEDQVGWLKRQFEELWATVEHNGDGRMMIVGAMMEVAYAHARALWDAAEQRKADRDDALRAAQRSGAGYKGADAD